MNRTGPEYLPIYFGSLFGVNDTLAVLGTRNHDVDNRVGP